MATTKTRILVSIFVSTLVGLGAIVGGNLLSYKSLAPQTSVAQETPSPTPTYTTYPAY